ncbi:hypothetical protein LCGC14_1581990 [marine sediment metagenome]|uniref:3'-5' exoribonuclease Rv2179c-like domain-containing protein n=1 Tax=marine sediment metagenome TaxID=412755 RepID=A0A0F9KX93_9ZZZZ
MDDKMVDCMLDMETMGITHNSVIVQIGACFFDRMSGEVGDSFIINIDIHSCIQAGLSMDASTVEWWLNQTNRTFLEKPVIHLSTALNEFYIFAHDCKYVWAHATFDFPILFNAFNKIGIEPPFNFRSARDLRTLVDLAGIPYIKSEDRTDQDNQHDSLSDCIYQVGYASKCFNIIEGKK